MRRLQSHGFPTLESPQVNHTNILGKYQLVVGRALVSGYTSYYDGLYYNYYYNINYGKTLGVAPDIVVGKTYILHRVD